MKNAMPLPLLFGAVLLTTLALLRGESADKSDLKELVGQYLAHCKIRVDSSGNPQSLVSAAGETLDLAKTAEEVPAPTAVVGYWYSPTMNFLSRQKIAITTAQDAKGAVKLFHALWRGPGFVQKKIYEARQFDGGWVIEVDHDFRKYPGSIQQIMPYELLVDHDHSLTQLRQRCYHYPGSEAVYTNTVISVYEREKGINGGINYPEALEHELRNAWEREKNRKQTNP
jgi:hypothetical protein